MEGLVEGDKLIYHGVELDDTKELFRYELKVYLQAPRDASLAELGAGACRRMPC